MSGVDLVNVMQMLVYLQHNRFRGENVQIWGGISPHHCTQLHIFQGLVHTPSYINEVLQPIVVLFFRDHEDLQIFHAWVLIAHVTQCFGLASIFVGYVPS